MSEHQRNNDWQVVGAVALIALGVVLFLKRIGGPWWDMVRRAFDFAFDVAWPLAVIALGVLLLLSARRGGFKGFDTAGKRLYRSRSDRMVGGVLAGLGDFLGIDPTWLRIGYVVLAVATGFGPAVIVYIIAMIIVPEAPKTGQPPIEWPQTASSQVPPVSQPSRQTPPPPPPPPAAG